jgi:hypothetical protein
MKKSFWKQRANRFEDLLIDAQRKVRALGVEADELRREVEDKRKNWAPIKIKHPYVPRDAGCVYCDDPAEDPRHG